MNQVIVELDDRTLTRLNRVAPPTARKRSDFIRQAILRALDAKLDDSMERAYREVPQEAMESDLDPLTWAPRSVDRKKKKKSRSH
jgi:predicted transcriptional regulator